MLFCAKEKINVSFVLNYIDKIISQVQSIILFLEKNTRIKI